MEVVEKRIFLSCANAGAELPDMMKNRKKMAMGMCMNASAAFYFFRPSLIWNKRAETSKAMGLGQRNSRSYDSVLEKDLSLRSR